MNDEEQAGSDDLAAPSAEQSKKAPNRYVSRFKQKAPSPAAKLLREWFPRGTPHAELTAFFAERAALSTVREWRRGASVPPAWAVELMRANVDRMAQLVDTITPGNSAAIGTQNLLRSHAERRARRAEKAERQD